ncbi:hypothetical protein BpHYR1_051106 [Brachionus plicatilis]|uniref:Uncharacterized protein n=1 Tax=Brachionus plicatilis TaxID=10195 RepID=A0A3M7S2F4_BRAPC|nr:hypothetical protein BpHYR1_051106 [Brachionus plicatilis]
MTESAYLSTNRSQSSEILLVEFFPNDTKINTVSSSIVNYISISISEYTADKLKQITGFCKSAGIGTLFRSLNAFKANCLKSGSSILASIYKIFSLRNFCRSSKNQILLSTIVTKKITISKLKSEQLALLKFKLTLVQLVKEKVKYGELLEPKISARSDTKKHTLMRIERETVVVKCEFDLKT